VYCTVFRFFPSPIGRSGSLVSGASVPVALSAKDAADAALPNIALYLSFKKASGGGSARIGSTALTSTPMRFDTNSNGTIQLTYTAPAPLPAGGQDAIVVQDRPSSPKSLNSDSYAFSAAIPTVSLGDVSAVEADEHPTIPLRFTVTLEPVQPNPVTVQYTTMCGLGDRGCGPGDDFLSVTTPITITIPAHTTNARIVVQAYSYIGAHAGETYTEGFFVRLSNPSGAVLGRSIGEGTILPDVESGKLAVADLYVGDVGLVPTRDPGGVPEYFTVTLGALESSAVSFHYATANGTALAGIDYAPASGTAVIPAGSNSVVLTISLLPNSPPSANKTFTLTISNSSGPPISRSTGTGTILAS
jgi:hypothetical protein